MEWKGQEAARNAINAFWRTYIYFEQIRINELGYVFADDGHCHAVCSDFYGAGVVLLRN